MPLKLIAPRPGRSQNWRIRGTYLGEYVDESAGTPDRKVAAKKLDARRKEIERGEFSGRGEPTFLSAAVAYIEAGGDPRFIGRYDPETGKWSGLIAHFRETPLGRIDQAAIDRAAAGLYPDATGATRNRQVHTPVSAVLKHAGVERAIRRPPGAQGKQRVDWLWPEQAFRIFEAAGKVDAEFRIFLVTLCYTGMRLSDGLGLECDRTRIAESYAALPDTKNGEPRGVHLPPMAVAELGNHPRGIDRAGERVFRFGKNGHLYKLLARTLEIAGEDLSWVTFHVFCHTWATWMRRYSGLDKRGLVGTGRWKDEKSVERYVHVVASEESRRADLLPTPPRTKRRHAPPIRAKSVESGKGRAKK